MARGCGEMTAWLARIRGGKGKVRGRVLNNGAIGARVHNTPPLGRARVQNVTDPPTYINRRTTTMPQRETLVRNVRGRGTESE
jgi:hypothetical protein